MSFRIVSALIGISVFVLVIFSIRRKNLQEKHALWWFLIALGVLLCGIFPGIVDHIGRYLGIHYPPILLLIVGVGIILIKLLSLNISISESEVRIRELAQRLAILEKKLDETNNNENITPK
ncbi:MAG: DUF2304 domain-containing protein [Thermodesulfobacteriota bacterium]|nr:DUF2304 domain-containing protein [Candidatus Desulfofervidus sp.]RKX65350.1 MAG: DUF2304 domain-containing protein [Thermodesulfobacteriota bacterium]